MAKRVIIAGNGPSLAQIDYDRKPLSCDIFRCNHFYLEDKYYLGKDITMAFMHVYPALEKYYTLKLLQERGEYNIDNITLATFGLNTVESRFQLRQMKSYFVDATFGHKILKKNKELYSLIIFNEIYRKGMRITSGGYMCCIAALLGYDEIYITGIDFYEKESYVYDISTKENLLKLCPSFENLKDGTPTSIHEHQKSIELQVLDFLQQKLNVKIYCISPNSPMCRYVDLAPKTQSKEFMVESKDSNAIRDIQVVDDSIKRIFSLKERERIERERIEREITLRLTSIKKNIYFQLLVDLFLIPRDIVRYIKYRNLKRKDKNK